MIASPVRRPRVVVVLTLALAILLPGTVPRLTVQAASPGMSGLHVAGNRLLNGAGQAVRLLGVNRSGTEYMCIHNAGIFDGPHDDASLAAIAAWHANTVRVPLNEDCWLGLNGAPPAYSGPAYQQAIIGYVTQITRLGMAAIVDLHWNAAGTAQAQTQQPMADADHAPAFWASVAGAFRDNTAVLFDLYNEPHGISWACWRDGGSCPGVAYPVAGMQTLVDAVRGTGAANVILAGGLAWSNDLSGWLADRPHDPTGNLAAAWHVYNFNACSTPACYDARVAPVLAQVPLVAGEVGENDCAHGFTDILLSWLDAHGGSYVPWAWNVQSCAGFPALITDDAGTPSGFGVGVRDHFAAAAGQPVPAPAPVRPATATPTPALPVIPSATAISPQPSATTVADGQILPSPTMTGAALPATPTSSMPTVSPSVPGGGAGLSVAARVSPHSGPYWGAEELTLTPTGLLSDLTVTLTVHRTPGLSYRGAFNTFDRGTLSQTHAEDTDTIVYTYTLTAGRTQPASRSLVLAAQFGGNGTAHPTEGDTYTVSAVVNGVPTTASGHFQ